MGFLLAGLLIAEPPSAGPEGWWINPSATVIVEVAPCGEAMLCGAVRWASDTAAADARRGGTDPLVGTEILRGFAAVAPGRWHGRLFIPDANRTAKAELRLVDSQTIKVRGCAAGKLICKSQLWKRTSPP